MIDDISQYELDVSLWIASGHFAPRMWLELEEQTTRFWHVDLITLDGRCAWWDSSRYDGPGLRIKQNRHRTTMNNYRTWQCNSESKIFEIWDLTGMSSLLQGMVQLWLALNFWALQELLDEITQMHGWPPVSRLVIKVMRFATCGSTLTGFSRRAASSSCAWGLTECQAAEWQRPMTGSIEVSVFFVQLVEFLIKWWDQ